MYGAAWNCGGVGCRVEAGIETGSAVLQSQPQSQNTWKRYHTTAHFSLGSGCAVTDHPKGGWE